MTLLEFRRWFEGVSSTWVMLVMVAVVLLVAVVSRRRR